MSSTTWEVSYFQIHTSASNDTADSLYANGNMQVPVDVYIRATDKDSNGKSVQYTLSDDQLNSIELVKYNDVSTQLTGDWSYTDTENEFDHSLGSNSSASASLTSAFIKADDSNSTQSKRYWISTTKVESQKIAASINQGDGTTITTHSKNFDSSVTITGVQPITYTTDNIKIDNAKGDTGQYKWARTTNGEAGTDTYKDWNQHNWYIATKAYDLKKVNVWNAYDTAGDDPRRPNLDKCYAFLTNSDNLKLFYIFDTSNTSPRDFGFDNSWDWTFTDEGVTYNVTDYADAVVSAKINQKAGTLNLSRFHFQHSGNTADLPWGGGNNPDPSNYDEWYFPDAGFQLWDRYGNTGTFSATYDEYHDNVVIKDTTSTGTSDFVKPSAGRSAKFKTR